MFVGNGRVGKSERLNQLLTRRLGHRGPFRSEEGPYRVTAAFQFCGPIKLADLGHLHGIDLSSQKDPDIFVVDCEGLHSLSDTTPGLKKATFALVQMSSLTVLVVHGMLNASNIHSARSLFVLSRAFAPDNPGFAVGTAVMMRDIGVMTHDPLASLATRDVTRRRQDCDQTEAVLAVLNNSHLKFNLRNFKVLAQPRFDDEELYWKSIEDLLYFVRSGADSRDVISGRFLCGLFDAAKPSVMKISDFDHPDVPFDAILSNHIQHQLRAARHSVIRDLEHTVQQAFSDMSPDQLRQWSPADFMFKQSRVMRERFRSRANCLCPGVHRLCPDILQEFENDIDHTVESVCEEAFLAACAEKLIPECKNSIFDNIRTEINREMDELATQSVGVYNFWLTSARYTNQAISQLRSQLQRVDRRMVSLPQFSQAVTDIQAAVEESANECEVRKRREYEMYQREERMRFEKELCDQLADVRENDREEIRRSLEESHKQLEEVRTEADRHRLAAEQRDRQYTEDIRALEARMQVELAACASTMRSELVRLFREAMSRYEAMYYAIGMEMAAETRTQLSHIHAELAGLKASVFHQQMTHIPNRQPSVTNSCLLL
jgi:hypothetical protein